MLTPVAAARAAIFAHWRTDKMIQAKAKYRRVTSYKVGFLLRIYYGRGFVRKSRVDKRKRRKKR